MKIAVDIRSIHPKSAGKGKYTENILSSLFALDHKNDYLLYTNNDYQIFDYPNVKTIKIAKKHIFWHLAVKSNLLKQKAKIFFAPTSYILPAILPSGVHSITTVHDLISFKHPHKHQFKAKWIEKILLKRALKNSEIILPVSSNTSKDLHDLFPYLNLKITNVPCAASTQFIPRPQNTLQQFVKQTALPSKFFLAIGSVIPRKNYLNLIRAFAAFNKQFPQYHLIIVGQKGWQYQEVFAEMDKLKVKRKTHFLDYIKDSSVAKLYNLAEALVFPSLYEGFGMPPLEAMQSGCPVIAHNASSIPEVTGNAALLTDCNHYQNISYAMQRLVSQEGLREDLIQRGLKQAQKFSWNNSAKKLLQIIQEIS